VRNLVANSLFQKRLSRQNKILEGTLDQLKETEIQLVQAEKLASLGRMSAGIIHEINNPLNFAKTALYALKMHGQALPGDDKTDFDEVLRDIEEGIDRVRNIVSDLRTFTHPNLEEQEEVDLRDVVKSALRFLSHEWKEKVKVEQDFSAATSVVGNPQQLTQVVLNLVQNALDALRAKTDTSNSPEVTIRTERKNGKILLRIRDNGSGISSENISKIFDPFFTTKDVGEGMGLGLSICYRIMQNHGGRILVESEPQRYCEFVLEFPEKSEE
jgi:two-component system sensor histidine kinase PhcS